MALEIVFWVSVGLIVYTHLGYPLLLLGPGRRLRRATTVRATGARTASCPAVSLIVAAYDEEEVIERKVANALALDYPRELLEMIVASDGSTRPDRRAGPRGRRRPRPRAAPRRQGRRPERGASSRADAARSSPSPTPTASGARTRCAAWSRRFADQRVGYVCGQVRFEGGEGGNQEGVYWRYEMAVREMESRLAGITAGNGAIYAVRREAYIELDPSRSHDLGFPFELAKRGWRAVYEPEAVAEEKMVPTVEGEFARKRRMMCGLWDVMLRWGMLDPRGYGPAYAFEIASHRLLRYLTPWLHLVAFGANIAAARRTAGSTSSPWRSSSPCWSAALLGRFVPALPVPDRLLLRHRDRLDRRRALGPAPRRRRADRLGEGGGHPMSGRTAAPDAAQQRLDVPERRWPRKGLPRAPTSRSPSSASSLVSPLLLVAAIAIQLESPGPVIYRQRRVGRDGVEFELFKLRTMRQGSDPVGVGTAVTARRPAGDPGRPLPAPLSRSTSSPTWSTCCAARWRSSARARRSRPRSRSTRPASAAASRSGPGSPAGPRSTAAPASPGRSGSSSTSGTSSTARCGSTCRSWRARPGALLGRRRQRGRGPLRGLLARFAAEAGRRARAGEASR